MLFKNHHFSCKVAKYDNFFLLQFPKSLQKNLLKILEKNMAKIKKSQASYFGMLFFKIVSCYFYFKMQKSSQNSASLRF